MNQYTTFSPVDGSLYAGDFSVEDFRYADSFYESKLATLVASEKSALAGSNIKTPDDFLKASVAYMDYKIHLEPQVESTVDQLIASKKSKQMLRQISAGVMTNPVKYMKILQASKQLSAAVDDDRVRDALALYALSFTVKSGSLTIKDPKESKNEGAPRATNNPLEDMAEIVADFNVNKSANIDAQLWNSVDFTVLLSNYFLKGHNPQAAYMGYGMFTLPQMPNQIMVVSPLAPRGYVYGVDRQASIVAEGAMVLEEEREADVFSNVAYLHDFVQLKVVKPKRFGLKVELGGYANGTRGKEITSLGMAQALAKPKVPEE